MPWRWSLPTVVLVPRGAWGTVPSRAERRRLFSWAANAGFDGIEISPRWLDVHALSGGELELLRADVEAEGLRVSGLNLNRFVLTRSPRADDHRSRFERSVDVAVALGAEVIVLSQSMPTAPAGGRPPLRGDDVPIEEHARAAELIAPVAARAAQAGVKLSFELHDDGLTDTPAWCLWHARACQGGEGEGRGGEEREREGDGRDGGRRGGGRREGAKRDTGSRVGVNPDLGNICRGPHALPDWESALRELAPYANVWHIKNYRDARPAPIWDGDIDYRRAFDIMRVAVFDGWISIESYSDADVLWLQQVSLLWAKDASCRNRNRN